MERSIAAEELRVVGDLTPFEPGPTGLITRARVSMRYWLGALATSSCLWLVLLTR